MTGEQVILVGRIPDDYVIYIALFEIFSFTYASFKWASYC